MISSSTYLSDMKLSSQHRESLVEGQSRLLEMIALGLPLEKTLLALTQLIESHSEGMYCSVLLLDEDGETIHPSASPNLPAEYIQALDGYKIGPTVGSCGTAMFRKSIVIVSDIETDPLWASYKSLIIPYGFRACWSSPIFLKQQHILGSFAMYYREVRSPGPEDFQMLGFATHVAGIAIERTRRENELSRLSTTLQDKIRELQESEQRLQVLNSELETRVRERTEESQHMSSFLQGIIDHIPNVIFYKGADLRFLGCNMAYEQTFGVHRQDLIGKTVLELDYLPVADRQVFQSEGARVIETASTHCREAIIPFADGREHHTLYSISGFRDHKGAPSGMVGVIVDITPQKEIEAQLREAKQRAEYADHLKSAFLATMSHELRTPLNSIIGFTGVIIQELAGPLTDEQKKQLGMVQSSARHLLALINDVLDISKIEAGEFSIASEPFDLQQSVTQVIGSIRPLAEKKGLELHVEIMDHLDTIQGDRRRTEQILLNLLSNAIKFTEKGSVTLTVEKTSGFASERGYVFIPALRFAISDTGIGIRPEDMTALFQPFRQIEATLSRQHEGTGLGLAICRRLSGLMGGHIEVSSCWQVGSTFTFILPIKSTG